MIQFDRVGSFTKRCSLMHGFVRCKSYKLSVGNASRVVKQDHIIIIVQTFDITNLFNIFVIF